MDSRIKVINKLIGIGKEFTTNSFCFPNNSFPGQFAGSEKAEWTEWKTRTSNIIQKSMDKTSPAITLVNKALEIKTDGNYFDQFELAKNSLLKALENTLEALNDDIYGELNQTESENVSPSFSNNVFIVHGHDSELKNDVERFIHEIGLNPIILHRQVDNGDTVIEKFEKHSDVGYAFILLTPDEIAYTIDQKDISEESRNIEYRTRANVIFEFGYFVGKLGRSRVCCLLKGETSMPSDLSGLVYKKIDGSIDSQAYSIIKELKQVGYKLKM